MKVVCAALHFLLVGTQENRTAGHLIISGKTNKQTNNTMQSTNHIF